MVLHQTILADYHLAGDNYGTYPILIDANFPVFKRIAADTYNVAGQF